jgi:hypothetical protein
MHRLLVAILGMALTTEPMLAQTYIGFGDQSCGSWAHERHTNSLRSIAYMSWVLGVLSGVNLDDNLLKRPDFLQNTDRDGVLGWMDNYCLSHPLDNLMSATVELIITLRKNSN